MVSFLLPRSHAMEIAPCPKQLTVARNEKEPLDIAFHRTSSKSPERARHRTDPDERSSKTKSANYNSWFKSITSPFVSGGNSLRTAYGSPSPLEAPTHVHRRTHSLVDSPKVSTSHTVDVEPRLPDHMRRPELQLRRIQGRRDQDPPSPKSLTKRSSSVERNQKHSAWWPA